jgi:hypothetical protein
MERHRIILPDGDWPVLITGSDPAAATVSFVVIAFSGPPEFRITRSDPAVRTMTVTPAPPARPGPGPYLLTARHGRIIALREITRL